MLTASSRSHARAHGTQDPLEAHELATTVAPGSGPARNHAPGPKPPEARRRPDRPADATRVHPDAKRPPIRSGRAGRRGAARHRHRHATPHAAISPPFGRPEAPVTLVAVPSQTGPHHCRSRAPRTIPTRQSKHRPGPRARRDPPRPAGAQSAPLQPAPPQPSPRTRGARPARQSEPRGGHGGPPRSPPARRRAHLELSEHPPRQPALAHVRRDLNGPPPFLISIYKRAGQRYDVPWPVLAAINSIETDYGRNLSVSSAGAVGWMQFMPGTWREYGVDANHDGKANPYDPTDAIFAAARYLHANGARMTCAARSSPTTTRPGTSMR